MKGISITITDDEVVVSEFDGPFADIQSVCGGSVEPVPSDNVVTLWVNEDGKHTGLPINYLAMDIWRDCGWDIYGCLDAGEWVAGNMVITGGADAHGHTKSLPVAARRKVINVCLAAAS